MVVNSKRMGHLMNSTAAQKILNVKFKTTLLDSFLVTHKVGRFSSTEQ